MSDSKNYSIYDDRSFEDLSREVDKEMADAMQTPQVADKGDCSAIYFSSGLRLKLYAIIFPVPRNNRFTGKNGDSSEVLYCPFLERREAFSYLWADLPVSFAKDYSPRAFFDACAYYIAMQEHRYAERFIDASEYHYRTVRTRVILKEYGIEHSCFMRFCLNVVHLYEHLCQVLSGRETTSVLLSNDLFNDEYNKSNIRMDHPIISNLERSDKWPLSPEDRRFMEEGQRLYYDTPIKVDLIAVMRGLAICSVFLARKGEGAYDKLMEVIEDHDLTKDDVIEYSMAMMNRYKIMVDHIASW